MAHETARIRTPLLPGPFSRGPFAARGAALHGRVPTDANARIRLCSGNRVAEVPLQGEEWGCFGLPPGHYRVEYISTRMILSRDVELVDEREIEIDFRLRL